eukprot:GHVT01080062.1.p1 GENE.GHVT01080062.1~~GHVT01080062.1.p1  ORF type:complete len:1009 (+),score=142.06 GHVT01080062.1:253-3279(+)
MPMAPPPAAVGGTWLIILSLVFFVAIAIQKPETSEHSQLFLQIPNEISRATGEPTNGCSTDETDTELVTPPTRPIFFSSSSSCGSPCCSCLCATFSVGVELSCPFLFLLSLGLLALLDARLPSNNIRFQSYRSAVFLHAVSAFLVAAFVSLRIFTQRIIKHLGAPQDLPGAWSHRPDTNQALFYTRDRLLRQHHKAQEAEKKENEVDGKTPAHVCNDSLLHGDHSLVGCRAVDSFVHIGSWDHLALMVFVLGCFVVDSRRLVSSWAEVQVSVPLNFLLLLLPLSQLLMSSLRGGWLQGQRGAVFSDRGMCSVARPGLHSEQISSPNANRCEETLDADAQIHTVNTGTDVQKEKPQGLVKPPAHKLKQSQRAALMVLAVLWLLVVTFGMILHVRTWRPSNIPMTVWKKRLTFELPTSLPAVKPKHFERPAAWTTYRYSCYLEGANEQQEGQWRNSKVCNHSALHKFYAGVVPAATAATATSATTTVEAVATGTAVAREGVPRFSASFSHSASSFTDMKEINDPESSSLRGMCPTPMSLLLEDLLYGRLPNSSLPSSSSSSCPPSVAVVTSHYGEDLSWIYRGLDRRCGRARLVVFRRFPFLDPFNVFRNIFATQAATSATSSGGSEKATKFFESEKTQEDDEVYDDVTVAVSSYIVASRSVGTCSVTEPSEEGTDRSDTTTSTSTPTLSSHWFASSSLSTSKSVSSDLFLWAPNVANEALAFLAYIVKFYDDLPEWTFFLHGHRTSYHNYDLLPLLGDLRGFAQRAAADPAKRLIWSLNKPYTKTERKSQSLFNEFPEVLDAWESLRSDDFLKATRLTAHGVADALTAAISKEPVKAAQDKTIQQPMPMIKNEVNHHSTQPPLDIDSSEELASSPSSVASSISLTSPQSSSGQRDDGLCASTSSAGSPGDSSGGSAFFIVKPPSTIRIAIHAQFAIHRSVLLRRPRLAWLRLLEFFMFAPIRTFSVPERRGLVAELLWLYLFIPHAGLDEFTDSKIFQNEVGFIHELGF